MAYQGDGKDQTPPSRNLNSILAALSSFTGTQGPHIQGGDPSNDPHAQSHFSENIGDRRHQPVPQPLVAIHSYSQVPGYGYYGYETSSTFPSQPPVDFAAQPHLQAHTSVNGPAIPLSNPAAESSSEPMQHNGLPPATSRSSSRAAKVEQSAPTSSQNSATITTWSAALRHVTRLAARNEELGQRITKVEDRQNECNIRI